MSNPDDRSAGPIRLRMSAEFGGPGIPGAANLVLPEPRKNWDPMLPWFAALMRAAREGKDLGRMEAGRRAQCSDETVRRMECLECEPSLDLAKRLCRIYDVRLGRIITEAERWDG